MRAVSGLSRALPLLVIAFLVSGCQLSGLGPPGVDCGPLLPEPQCAEAANKARLNAPKGMTIWAIRLHAGWHEVIFTDGTRISVTVDFAPPAPSAS